MRQLPKRAWHRLLYILKWAEERRCRQLARYRIAGDHRRIYLFHIRKTGGTSLNQMFLSLGGQDGRAVFDALTRKRNNRVISGDKVFVAWIRLLIEKGHYYYAFSHLPEHALRLPDKTFTITCLRDPVDRLLSHYRMLLDCERRNAAAWHLKDERKWLGNSIEDFLRNIDREHLLRQLYMFSASYNVSEAAEKIARCSHYFFTEDFAAGAGELSAKLGAALTPVHARKTAAQLDVTASEREHLRSMLDPEYDLIDMLRRRA